MGQPAATSSDTFKLAMVVELAVLAVAALGLYGLEVPVSWWGHGLPTSLAFGLLAAGLSFAGVRWLIRWQSVIGAELRSLFTTVYPLFRHFSWPQIIVTATAAGACEELLFRGLLQTWLAGVSTPAVAVLATAVVFGLLHCVSFSYFVMTTVMGLLLGIGYWFSDSLLLVIVWHGVYDLLAIAALAKYPHWFGIPYLANSATVIKES
ncbi:MAG: CPBP family intramembrane glutamic endopeptidase [Marinobacter sp.]|uniref:CPBP family intramembrane glutamic endopeptidase n=1 Tax=Marinobacter sp. TaxID=50741 RepID=UPI00299EF3D7|nr:CPBP family intramembrane glutamic endopeptidase [Marinobacter sp.]MDX1757048.1 CPBP family intramembrane glutamic endopeptidase [Marinobacter sp.]